MRMRALGAFLIVLVIIALLTGALAAQGPFCSLLFSGGIWGSGGCHSTQVGEVLMHIAKHMIRRWSSWLKNRKNAAGRLPGTLRLYNSEQQSLE